ncbi:VOC family protein [Streptomyces kronopolitis]|uniref:VOC family protein n=1 Tax=Streptomyces kronopolitis TaxID=1612435 RepID=UPI003D959BAE
MSEISSNQPFGTPTWVDLGVPDLDRAQEFYRALFGWEYAPLPTANGPLALCLLRGRRVASLRPRSAADAAGESWWLPYLATDDCDGAVRRITGSGGSLLAPPADLADLARTAVVTDCVGAPFGLWQGQALPGCELVNEPCTLVRNDLSSPAPEPARRFYAGVFGFTLDGNDAVPDLDFTFLRRPDGHEIGGVFGAPAAEVSRWQTVFEVADTDELVALARAAGGTADDPEDAPYGRMAAVTDPFGTAFSVITRPPVR